MLSFLNYINRLSSFSNFSFSNGTDYKSAPSEEIGIIKNYEVMAGLIPVCSLLKGLAIRYNPPPERRC